MDNQFNSGSCLWKISNRTGVSAVHHRCSAVADPGFCRAILCISAAYPVMRCLSVCPSVCPSGCLSRSCILSKRIKISSRFSPNSYRKTLYNPVCTQSLRTLVRAGYASVSATSITHSNGVVTIHRRLRSTCCTDRHEASRGLSVTAGLLVQQVANSEGTRIDVP